MTGMPPLQDKGCHSFRMFFFIFRCEKLESILDEWICIYAHKHTSHCSTLHYLHTYLMTIIRVGNYIFVTHKMLHNAVMSLFWKAQEVTLLYYVALRWRKLEQHNRKHNVRKARPGCFPDAFGNLHWKPVQCSEEVMWRPVPSSFPQWAMGAGL